MRSIEPAQVADIPALISLLELLFKQETDFQPAPEKQRRGLELILARPESAQILVARDAHGVAGMVNLQFILSTAEGGRVAWLEDLIVHPEFRGQGIGSELLDGAIAFCRGQGLARITLLTDFHNLRAQEFYASRGFKRSAMIPLRLHL